MVQVRCSPSRQRSANGITVMPAPSSQRRGRGAMSRHCPEGGLQEFLPLVPWEVMSKICGTRSISTTQTRVFASRCGWSRSLGNRSTGPHLGPSGTIIWLTSGTIIGWDGHVLARLLPTQNPHDAAYGFFVGDTK